MKKIFLTVLIFLLGVPLFAQDAAKKIDDLVSTYNEYGYFDGSLLVSDKGSVVLKKGYGMANIEWNIPNTPDTKFRLGSITKQFTSMLIMQLVEKGKINLDGKITDYLPYYRKDTGDRITIHMLLTHTSGIPSYTSQPDFGKTSRMYYKPDDFIKEKCSGDLEFEPGSKIEYDNSGYFILGAIIEHVTGMSYEEALKENILGPLGMKNTGYDHPERIIPKRASGYDRRAGNFKNTEFIDMSLPYAAGALYSTVEDLLVWDKALQTDKLLSPELKKKMFHGYMKMGDMYYGYGWMIGKKIHGRDSLGVIVHGGGINGFNTLNLMIPEAGQYVILFSNAGGAPLEKMADQIIDILEGKKVFEPRKSLVLTMRRTLDNEGIESAIAKFKELKDKKDEYAFDEGELNLLGYDLLQEGKTEYALEIFKLNTQEFPKSANAYDSYGEALLKKGLKEDAEKNYRKSLELNPGNENAIKVLKEMGAADIKTSEVSLTEEELKAYAGTYQLAPTFSITVTVEGNRIFGQGSGQPRFELFAASPDKFYLKVVNAQISFQRKDGKVTGMVLFQNRHELPGKKIE
ncbi:MAG: serine hydrolase [Ignavibacteria bacterium]|jgi:CubicO group peptidase (beta-lactamase class C family)|nr:serine hydrolase [Ignavibacteria bacterium]MCU7502889.1 serine hydrolase [Ignavibacteria bacterium]MCU7515617.1 serine hydrolase [Ignavibacteria bacterium]